MSISWQNGSQLYLFKYVQASIEIYAVGNQYVLSYIWMDGINQ